MASVGEYQVVDITPVWHLLIMESKLVRSINHNVMCFHSSCPHISDLRRVHLSAGQYFKSCTFANFTTAILCNRNNFKCKKLL